MRPTFAQGRKAAIAKLLTLRQQAQSDKEPRMLLRIQGILMSLDGHTTGEIADHLKVHRSTIPLWIDQWNRYGKEGLLEGHRSGRPTALSQEDRERLCDILDSGPVGYGLATGIWTSPLVRQIIEDEFGRRYHAGHVRKLLRQMGYSVQRPTTQLVQANVQQHRKWQMGALHVPESKKNAKTEGAVIVFEDEASFRQTPTLHATWARRGSQPRIPTRGERNTQKIFGAVRLDNANFIYLHQEDYFQWETYLAFLEQVAVPAFYRRRHRIYLIQDNASYHKKEMNAAAAVVSLDVPLRPQVVEIQARSTLLADETAGEASTPRPPSALPKSVTSKRRRRCAGQLHHRITWIGRQFPPSASSGLSNR